MNKKSKYSSLLIKYPEYMSKEQMYKECHISKKTCLYLLQSGLVPCLDSGKKTRCYKIKTIDVIRYLDHRDSHPERYMPKLRTVPQKLARPDLGMMRSYYINLLNTSPDVLSTTQISRITGYSKSTVIRWCHKGYLQPFRISGNLLIPKMQLVHFLSSEHFSGIVPKSAKHNKIERGLYEVLGSQV